MSSTYTAITPQGQVIVWRDRKRWAWLLSVVWPLVPLLGLWAHHATGHEIALGLPLLISYGSVSYTHLDVYKRQPPWPAAGCRRW